jgi:hypothetical protein
MVTPHAKETKNDSQPTVTSQQKQIDTLAESSPSAQQQQSSSASGTSGEAAVIIEEIPGVPDWVKVDNGQGAVYYVNVNTHQTSWTLP